MHSNNYFYFQWNNSKSILFTLIFLNFYLFAIAQNVNLNFAMHAVSSTDNAFGSNDIEIDANGDLYMAGRFAGTADFDPSAASYTITSSGTSPSYYDVYVAKNDSNGGFIWAKQFKSQDFFQYLTLGSYTLDASGNFYMSGVYKATIDFDPGPGVNNLTCPGSNTSCIYTVKLDPSGNFVNAWSIMEGGSARLVNDIQVDTNGDVFLAGYYKGTQDFQHGAGTQSFTSTGTGPDGFILKLDSNMDFQWLKTIQSTDESQCRHFDRDNSGNIYVTGNFKGTTDFNPGAGTNNIVSVSGLYDTYILKLNSSGTFLWVDAFLGSGHINTSDIEISSDGTDIVMGGQYQGTVDFDPTAGTDNRTASPYNYCLVNINPSGSIQWVKSTFGSGSTSVFDVDFDSQGDIYFSGGYYGTVDMDPSTGVDSRTATGSGFNRDGYFTKLLNDGTYAYTLNHSGAIMNIITGIAINGSPNNLYLSGYFGGTTDVEPLAGVTNLTSTSGSDAFLTNVSYCPSSYSSTDVISAGSSYTWIDGNTYTSDNNTATYTATAVDGCDSIVSLDLTIFNPGGVSGATSWIKGDVSMYRESDLSSLAVHGDTVAAAKNFVGGNPNLLKANANNADSTIYKTSDPDLNYNPYTAHTKAAFIKSGLAFNDVFSSTNGLTYYVIFTAVDANPNKLVGGAFTPTQTILADSPCGNPRCYTGLRNNGSRVAGQASQLGFLSTITPVSGEPILAGGYSDFTTDEFNVLNGGWNSRSAYAFQEYTGAVYKYRIFGWNSNYKTGNFAEAMTFDRMLTEAERRKVESYLGIKYGITLHPYTGAQGDYISSAGTVFWDSQTNTSYHNRIVGLGRDDISGLNQKQARIGSGDLVAYIGTLSASNAANTASFASDDSFFTIGDNDEAKSATASSNAEIPGTCSLYSRIAREWKVSRTNMAEAISLEIILGDAATSGGVRVTDLRLLVDNDGDFSNGGTSCFAHNSSGLTISYNSSTGVMTFTNISTSILPNNTTRFITIASVSDATALPVDLYSFSGSCEEGQPLLNWQSMSEYNNDYYLIERSKDGRIFEHLNTIAGKGTIDEISHYYYIDTDNVAGGTYYRLSQVDFDGTKSVFKTIYLNCVEDIMIDIYPNPFEQTLHVRAEGPGLFTVRDLRGSLVFQSRYLQGEQTFNMPDKLNAGVYTVEFRSDSGSILHRKMIKQ